MPPNPSLCVSPPPPGPTGPVSARMSRCHLRVLCARRHARPVLTHGGGGVVPEGGGGSSPSSGPPPPPFPEPPHSPGGGGGGLSRGWGCCPGSASRCLKPIPGGMSGPPHSGVSPPKWGSSPPNRGSPPQRRGGGSAPPSLLPLLAPPPPRVPSLGTLAVPPPNPPRDPLCPPPFPPCFLGGGSLGAQAPPFLCLPPPQRCTSRPSTPGSGSIKARDAERSLGGNLGGIGGAGGGGGAAPQPQFPQLERDPWRTRHRYREPMAPYGEGVSLWRERAPDGEHAGPGASTRPL